MKFADSLNRPGEPQPQNWLRVLQAVAGTGSFLVLIARDWESLSPLFRYGVIAMIALAILPSVIVRVSHLTKKYLVKRREHRFRQRIISEFIQCLEDIGMLFDSRFAHSLCYYVRNAREGLPHDHSLRPSLDKLHLSVMLLSDWRRTLLLLMAAGTVKKTLFYQVTTNIAAFYNDVSDSVRELNSITLPQEAANRAGEGNRLKLKEKLNMNFNLVEQIFGHLEVEFPSIATLSLNRLG